MVLECIKILEIVFYNMGQFGIYKFFLDLDTIYIIIYGLVSLNMWSFIE